MLDDTTRRGENIVSQITDTEDAYGDTDALTDADIYQIIDALHTHVLDTRGVSAGILTQLANAVNAISTVMA